MAFALTNAEKEARSLRHAHQAIEKWRKMYDDKETECRQLRQELKGLKAGKPKEVKPK